MFTECPECSTAFRVTATVLQQAGGRVRCGGCGNAFSAIDHQTEELPGPDDDGAASAAAAATDESSTGDQLGETSRRLLETLDKLAGPDEIRVEDTGIEWRVVGGGEETAAAAEIVNSDKEVAAEAAPDQPGGEQESLVLEDVAEKPREERRYDDNTPLPDDFDNQEEYEYTPPPQRRANDHADQDSAQFDEKQPDLALSEPEDWTDLLDEVVEEGVAAGNIPLEVEEELAAIHSELSAKVGQVSEKPTTTETQPPDLDTQFETQAEAMGLEISGVHEVADDAGIVVEAGIDEGEQGIAANAAPTEAAAPEGVPVDVTEEDDLTDAVPLREDDEAGDMTLDEVIELSLEDDVEEEESDQEVAAGDTPTEAVDEAVPPNEKMDLAATLSGMDDPSKLFDEDSVDVETIVMEGDFVGSSETARLEAEQEAQERFKEAGNLIDTYAANRGMRGGRRSTDPAGYGVIGGTILLVLILAGQVIHAYREPLSTYGLFNQAIGPIYRMLGNPVTPEWDIKGWQFEATNGSVAVEEEVLTIFSRIGNRSKLPLPYPLVHVSLTDRWEEIIGSRVLEPNEYLAGDLDPSSPVIPGENFTAVITIEEPSAEATGFKLNVCYRVSPGRVRCATEDFKN